MSSQLTQQQAAVVFDRGGQLLVSAAAGSGKTRVLVERLLGRVEEECLDLDRFLVITYTKAAASELRGKILEELNRRLARDPENTVLRRQKLVIYRAQISTIHSFCTELLREHGYLAELEPDFRVVEENESGLLKEKVLARVLERHYETLRPEDDFSRLVDTMSAGRDDSRLSGIILDIHRRIQSHPAPELWLEEQKTHYRKANTVTDVGDTVWGALLLEDACRQGEYWRQRMVELLDRMQGDSGLENAYAPSIDDTIDSLDAFVDACSRGWAAAGALSEINFPRFKAVKNAEDPALKDQVKLVREQCRKRMKSVANRFTSGEQLLEDMREVTPSVEMLLDLVWEFELAYREEKHRLRRMDFSDLEHYALKILTNGSGAPTALALRYREKYAEVMVDEYQDTNAVQNAIFDAVSGGDRLFQVGDVKQSIYRFRLADPTIFLEKYRSFPTAGAHRPGEEHTIVLSRNFRSRASVLNGVNFLFENIMSTQFGEMEYSEDQRLYPGLPYPEHPDDRVELNILDLANVEKDVGKNKRNKDSFEAEFVANRIKSLLDSGFPITDGTTLRPVRPEDIAILYRSPGSVMRHLRKELDRLRIPWSAKSDVDIMETDEVQTAVAFLEITDNPHQDVPLLAVLTSPVWGMSGDRLAQLRSRCREGDLYTCLCRGEERGESDCASILASIKELRAAAVDESGHRMLWRIYDGLGLMTVYSAMEGGSQRRNNLRLLYDYVCRLEQNGHQGVFGVVAHFRDLRRREQKISAANQDNAGVRVMSIHKSKGLEFPVVVLAGLNRMFNRKDQQEPVLFHPKLGIGPKGVDPDRRVEYETLARRAVALELEREMKSEELRLLYVAMTRTREKLIMTASFQTWQKDLERLAPETGATPDPQALSGKNSMAEWILLPVLSRLDAAPLRAGRGVSVPLIVPEDQWDIRLVEPETVAPEKLRQREKQEEDAGSFTEEDLARIRWTYPHRELADVPSKVTATQMKGRTLDEEVAEHTAVSRVRMPELAPPRFLREERALTPAQVGTAFHTLLQLMDISACVRPEGVEEELKRLVRMECLTPEQAEAIRPEQVAAFAASPLGREAAGAKDLRREFKFSMLAPATLYDPHLPEEEEVLLQGVVDCCFTGKTGMTVIDFKTDRVSPGGEKEYSRRYLPQIQVYTRALEEIFGKKVTRRVLWYLSTSTGVDV